MGIGNKRGKAILHVGFLAGLALKGVDSLLEIAGGAFLLSVNSDRFNWRIRLMTQHELSEDPRDMVANLLISFGRGLSISAQQFSMLYLILHGAIKGALVVLLWKRKLRTYPLAMAVLALFVAYQVYRYTFEQSAFLLMLTVFDIVMIVLTLLEYKRLKGQVRTPE